MDRFHQRIREKTANPWEPPVLIVAFGDSVTQGMTSIDAQVHDEVYHARFTRLLEHRYPLCTFSVLNAGISGQTAPGALSLVERDVVRHQPDLTIVGFGLNDAWNGLADLPLYVDSMSEIVRQVRASTDSDIVLLTPNFMNTREPDGVDAEARPAFRASADLQNRGVLSAYAQAVRDIARTHDLSCADVYRVWEERQAAGIDVDAMLANHMNHPSAEAHAIPAELLLHLVVTAERRAGTVRST
jgi:lysophospholipase L1-like esterase